MGDGAAFSLILHDLAEGHAGGIVDADVNELPADPASIALAGAIVGDAMPDTIEFAKLFDVDVDQFTGMPALIAPHRLGRLQCRNSVQAEPVQDPADGDRRDAKFRSDCLPVWR